MKGKVLQSYGIMDPLEANPKTHDPGNKGLMGRSDDPITVYVNDRPRRAWRWMEVRHLCADLPEETRQALEEGRATVRDAHGNQVGSGGALLEGSRYYIVMRKKDTP